MKKLIVASLITLLSPQSTLLAQNIEIEGKILSKPVSCFPLGQITSLIKDKLGETPIFGGETVNGITVAVFINSETRTWSVIEIHKTSSGEIVCILGAGIKHYTADWRRVNFSYQIN